MSSWMRLETSVLCEVSKSRFRSLVFSSAERGLATQGVQVGVGCRLHNGEADQAGSTFSAALLVACRLLSSREPKTTFSNVTPSSPLDEENTSPLDEAISELAVAGAVESSDIAGFSVLE
jgi:hypothetical protein